MDAARFDTLVRSLGAAASRRGVLTVLLTGLLAPLQPAPSEARRTRHHGRSKDRGNGSGKRRDRHRNKGDHRGKARPRQTQAASACFPGSRCNPGPGAYLAKCDFAGSSALKNVTCTGCNLSGASLRNADASGAHFSKANLSKACLVDANLSSATINSSTNTSGAIFCRTKMPNGSISNSGCSKGTNCCPTCIEVGKACGNGLGGVCCGGATCQHSVCACPASNPHNCGGVCKACCEDNHCPGETPHCCNGVCKGCCDAADCEGNACCNGVCCPEHDVCHQNACCTPRVCPAGACGAMSDGCGGTLQCGSCGNPTPICAANTCHACSAEHPCPAGEICCDGGSCFAGTCCDDDACPPSGNVCLDHQCRCGATVPCAGATPRCCDGVCGECCANHHCPSGICCNLRCCALEEVCDTSVDPDQCCTPAVCPDGGCGTMSDGCGTTLQCGECSNPYPICFNNIRCTSCSATLPCPSGCCDQGQCVAVADCPAPSNQCQQAVCSHAGFCAIGDKPSGTACDDGNACTTNTTCSGGACVGEAIVCPDGPSCTEMRCDPTLGCVYTPLPLKCLIDGVCRSDGEPSPDNLCLICDPAQSQTSWTTLSDGSFCDISDHICRCGECRTCVGLNQECETACDCCPIPGAVVNCRFNTATGMNRCCKESGACQGSAECCAGCVGDPQGRQCF